MPSTAAAALAATASQVERAASSRWASRTAARLCSSVSRSAMARHSASVSPGSKVARGVAAASARAVVAEASAGVPHAADSSTGRPKPSASDGITVTRARR